MSDHFSERTSHLPLRTLHQAIDSASNPLHPVPHHPWPGGMREAIKSAVPLAACWTFSSNSNSYSIHTPPIILPSGPAHSAGRLRHYLFEVKNIVLGPSLCLLMLVIWSLLFLSFSLLFFIFSRCLLGSMLALQDDPPNLKNLDSTLDMHLCLKDRLFIFQDGLGSVLEVSWAPFGSSWGSLGGLLGDLWRLLGVSSATFGGFRSNTDG